jgi:hypothetical protein
MALCPPWLSRNLDIFNAFILIQSLNCANDLVIWGFSLIKDSIISRIFIETMKEHKRVATDSTSPVHSSNALIPFNTAARYYRRASEIRAGDPNPNFSSEEMRSRQRGIRIDILLSQPWSPNSGTALTLEGRLHRVQRLLIQIPQHQQRHPASLEPSSETIQSMKLPLQQQLHQQKRHPHQIQREHVEYAFLALKKVLSILESR